MQDSGSVQAAAKEAVAFCNSSCFHQFLSLPATGNHPQLRVTFATTRNFEADHAEALPTVLFCLPMGASRLLIYDLDHVASKAGVKLIVIDRPGLGGSTPVPLDQRVGVWLEMAQAVLKRLQVRHVSLLSHSVGAVYLQNIILRLPEILHPTRAFAAVLENSTSPLSTLVEKLPQSWIGQWHNIQGYIRGNIIPPLQFSSAMIGASLGSGVDDADSLRIHGFTKAVWDQVSRLQGQYIGAEDSRGISDDALLCMRKGGRFWGVCDDLPPYIEALHQEFAESGRRLTFRAFFSESDVLIGKGGQAYYEKCWEIAAQKSNAGAIDFYSELAPGTNHDTIVLPDKGCIQKILGEIGTLIMC